MHSTKNFSFKPSDLEQIRHILRLRHPSAKQQLIPTEKHPKTFTLTHQTQSLTFAEHVEPQLTNHQSSLKISPNLLNYISYGINQVYIFYGQQEQRLETFLGSPSDPGLLMVLMVYLMQQKYKLSHNELELKVSFLESNNNELLDLLIDQKLSLKHIELSSWIKINQYLQYLKTIKLALYTNKKRDFKISKFDDDKVSKDSSIFIARVQVKLGEMVSEIILVDVPVGKKKEKVRNDWQSFLHSFKREGMKTELNQLSEFLLGKLNKGVLTMVCSMSLAKQKISNNMARLKEIEEFIAGNPLSKIKVKQHHFIDISLKKIDNLILTVINIVKSTKYDSVQSLTDTLHNIREWKKICLIKVKRLGETMLKILENRIKIGLYNYACFSERRDLIGRCVKNQNLKEFYNSKTYQSLYREVDIKTERSKKIIKELLKQNLQLKSLFHSIKKEKVEIKIGNPEIEPLLKNVIRLIHVYFLNEKVVLRLGTAYWINFCLKKVEMEDKIKEFENSINFIETQIQMYINVKQCSFKQDLIVSISNPILKAQKHATVDQKPTILPKLLFKKIAKPADQLPETKFQVKLSDFLFKLPRTPQTS